MLFDVRTYVCHPGKINAQLALYERLGKAPQYKHLGKPFAYLRGETGNPNEFIHIWKYDNAADRETRRASMWADPDWLAYTKASAELGGYQSQSNKLLNNVSFWSPPV